jgi:hypothetical protein
MLKVSVTPKGASLKPGGTIQFTAVVIDDTPPVVRAEKFDDGTGHIVHKYPGLDKAEFGGAAQRRYPNSLAEQGQFVEGTNATVPLTVQLPNAKNVPFNELPADQRDSAREGYAGPYRSQQDDLTKRGISQEVVWSANIGSVSASGLYTAPDPGRPLQNATIKATLVSDASTFGSGTVVIDPSAPDYVAEKPLAYPQNAATPTADQPTYQQEQAAWLKANPGKTAADFSAYKASYPKAKVAPWGDAAKPAK